MNGRKILSAFLTFSVAVSSLVLMSAPVGASYDDGELIYSENFDGKRTEDIDYGRQWYTGEENFIGYEVSENSLHVTATKENSRISYLEIVPAGVFAGQTKYTVTLDIMPIGLGSAPKSFAMGVAIHSAFPADASKTNDYDSYIFRDYNADGRLTFSRYLRKDGKSVSAKDITAKGAAGEYGNWYRIKLEIDGKNVSAYFNGSETPVSFDNSYDNKSPLCLVSLGAAEYRVDNIEVRAGIGAVPLSPVVPGTYADGDIIYEEKFDGKTAGDIKYSRKWYTGASNRLSYGVTDGILTVKSDTDKTGDISYLEIVPAELLGDRTAYTVTMDIRPVGLGAVPKSYGCGIALHSAFPGDRNLTNTYDSFIFRDYNGDGRLTFSRFRRDAGKLAAMKDITEKNGAGGYGEWYSVRLEVNGKTVTAYFNGSETPVVISDSYENKSPVCLVSVGASEFSVDNIRIWAGVGVEPNNPDPDPDPDPNPDPNPDPDPDPDPKPEKPKGYRKGDTIYRENFDGSTEIKLGTDWFTGSTNPLRYSADGGVLHVRNAIVNAQINFLELVSSERLKGLTDYTIELDFRPEKVDSKSYGVGLAIHPAFPADPGAKRTYDEIVFRDYNADSTLSVGRFRRENGKAAEGSNTRLRPDIPDGFGKWYRLKLEVSGSRLKMWLDGELILDVSDSTVTNGPICLVSVGSGEFSVDNVHIRAGVGLNPATGDGICAAAVVPAVLAVTFAAVSLGKRRRRLN